ncbi:MAG: nitroreductase [Pseudomonadota bacterium]
MKVSDAIAQRRSCRAFLDTPPAPDLVRDVLVKAARTASGGNVQPWQVWTVQGDRMDDFKALMAERSAKGLIDSPEYPVYPQPLKAPYRDYRFAVGEAMYAELGIPRDDKQTRLKWFANNYQFFGAPAGAFLFVDRDMTIAQWTDLGAYLTTAMLLFEEAGLATCPQECWTTQWKAVSEFLGTPDDLMLFAGLAIGYHDPDAPVNRLHTDRADPSAWLHQA